MKIQHPLYKKLTLNYEAPNTPENCVFVRGRIREPVLRLPEVWNELIDLSTVTVHLTPIGANQNVSIKRIQKNEIHLQTNGMPVDCFYLVFAERKDVPKLEVEQPIDTEQDT